MSLTFQQVDTKEEIAEVVRLAADIWSEYYITLITREQIDYMVEKFQSIPAITDQIHHQGYEYYLMRGEAAGAALGYLAVKREEGKLFLSKFYIGKKHRGNGYASQATVFLEQLCKTYNLRHMWLTVHRYNESSIAVYKRKGFDTIREQVSDIGNGFIMDAYIMEKEVR